MHDGAQWTDVFLYTHGTMYFYQHSLKGIALISAEINHTKNYSFKQ